MSFSYKLLSHTGEKPENTQLLADHLKGAADIALKNHRIHGVKEELEDIIELICLCHDFGKASPYFQKYLKNEYSGELKNHGEISAYFVYYMLPEKYRLLGFMCIKRHHGDMENGSKLFSCDEENILQMAAAISENLEELNAIYGTDISGFFHKIKEESFLKAPKKEYQKKGYRKFTVEELVLLEYLWSLLLTADKTQLIRGEAYLPKSFPAESYVESYKNRIRKSLIEKNPGIEGTELFAVRESIYSEIIESIDRLDIHTQHRLSINVPTGTGKTLGVYGAAFRLGERLMEESGGRTIPSIIYAIPFTSVIDQNYDVLEKLLQHNQFDTFEESILKHHSLTELRYRCSESEEYKDYDARFCVENWQSTIITTTFVQIFNTIFKTGTNNIGHRFHKLAGSIIILDEIQAIDPKYYNIIEEVFDILCRKYNTYVIVVTATKPLLLQGTELVTHNEDYFRCLDRIQIHNNTDRPMSLNEFCELAIEDINENEDKSFLLVLNTVKAALTAADFISEGCKGRKLIYLSTEIYPKRRLELINEIKENKAVKYIVVSTQLIEAGVDVDFDIVYRDFSTMDSINQTSGRANRNGLNSKGIVKLYMLYNEEHKNTKYSSYIYPPYLLSITQKILNGRTVINESDIFEINNRYFAELDRSKSDDKSELIKAAIKNMNFEEIRRLFELIPENYPKEDIIININEEAQECIDKILEGGLGMQEMTNCWRRLNQYKVSVSTKALKDINDIFIEDKNMRILRAEDYDIDRGIKRMGNMIW